MSRDNYQLDRHKHGGLHVDRYTRAGKNVGRYRLDKTPIKHQGKLPPAVPSADFAKFEAAVSKKS